MMVAEQFSPTLYNVEAEAAVIGGLMQDNRQIDSAADKLTVDDFTVPAMGAVFAAIVREHSRGMAATPVTLRPYFENDPAFADVGGAGYLAFLTGNTSAIGLTSVITQVAELAARRRLATGLTDTLTLAEDPTSSIASLIDAADAAIYEATSKGDPIHQPTALQCFDELIGSFDEEIEQVTCNQIPSLDAALGGIRPKELVLMAGRPGMGKTAVALSYSVGAARSGYGVLFISLEMSARELTQRMAADMCFQSVGKGVPYSNIRNRELNQWQRQDICRAREIAADMPFQIVDAGSLSIGRLAMIVRRHKRRFAAKGTPLNLVVVDYLQLLQSNNAGRAEYERVSEVSVGMKAIAKDNDVAVLALAQLSRAVEQRDDKRPMLSDLRSSGQLEQDADSIAFLYRHEYYLRQSMPDAGDPKCAEIERAIDACRDRIDFIVPKRRNGEPNTTQGFFFGGYQAVRG